MFSRLEVPDADEGFFSWREKKGNRRKERNEERKKMFTAKQLWMFAEIGKLCFVTPPTGCFNEQDLTLVLHARAQSEEQRCKVSTAMEKGEWRWRDMGRRLLKQPTGGCSSGRLHLNAQSARQCFSTFLSTSMAAAANNFSPSTH